MNLDRKRLLEEIAGAAEDVGKQIAADRPWYDFARRLRELAEEEKEAGEILLGWDEGITETTCHVYGRKEDDGSILVTRVEYLDKKEEPITFSPEPW